LNLCIWGVESVLERGERVLLDLRIQELRLGM
jgi:hypothetical protein